MTLHNDIENEETTLRIKITTVLLLAWSIIALAVTTNFGWSYRISTQLAEHETIDNARVARLEVINQNISEDLMDIKAQQLTLIRNQERVLEALKMRR